MKPQIPSLLQRRNTPKYLVVYQFAVVHSTDLKTVHNIVIMQRHSRVTTAGDKSPPQPQVKYQQQ